MPAVLHEARRLNLPDEPFTAGGGEAETGECAAEWEHASKAARQKQTRAEKHERIRNCPPAHATSVIKIAEPQVCMVNISLPLVGMACVLSQG